jgi:hypothetical protein
MKRLQRNARLVVLVCGFALVTCGTVRGQALHSHNPPPSAYTGQDGIIDLEPQASGGFVAYAYLRLRDTSTATTRLVPVTLTGAREGTVQAANWPRAHQGLIFDTHLNPAKYPQFVFLAYADAAAVTPPWVYPAAFSQDGQSWTTLGLFAKDPIEQGGPSILSAFGTRNPGSSRESTGYSSASDATNRTQGYEPRE